jgi:radical SAM superfamily enzyme YgiQ (UPF0313 family)
VADIVIINPRFEVSYWGIEHALPFFGKSANLPVASLPLLAALTPAAHRITLIDENVEAIDFERCAAADIVGITGMSVQRFRMTEILTELKRRGIFTVVGGPWVTVDETYFADLADVIFVGEAEETWPRFLADWAQSRHERRYEQSERTDMSHMPVPRFDLLKMQHYLYGSVQFSRGCPFACEFCDIIVVFGRRPRLKTSTQVIAEVTALRGQGMRSVFIVDDNLIGNKKAIKPVLRALADWQKQEGYPLTFFTEATIDLADDAELMALMVEANIVAVFVGIESPNEASLRETKKFQNIRPGRSMIEKVHGIQSAGIEVWCGMIVGFDNDDPTIFDAQCRFLAQARITQSMTGMLAAIPKTPLHARLAKEGRLDPADSSPYGTNVIPLRLSREQLRDGYVRVMREIYAPDAYFARLNSLFIGENFTFGRARSQYWRRHPWQRRRVQLRQFVQTMVIIARLMRRIPDPALRRTYRRQLLGILAARRDLFVVHVYAIRCALHFHAQMMVRQMDQSGGAIYNTI